MSVTSLEFAEKQGLLGQIDRISQSQTLRKAESLCKLLRYLAEHALTQPGVPLKEYQIATEVFGRPGNFDPQADSAIRVQAGRLRLKLLDYYSHEGSADPIVVEVPHGSYALRFHYRQSQAPLTLAGKPDPAPGVDLLPPPNRVRRWAVTVAVLSFALAVALAAVVTLAMAVRATRSIKASAEPAAPSLRAFWSEFASGAEVPWVVFSNAAFVGRPETGMRYLDPAHDSHDHILDHYTGVGEVLAVHELDRVFNQLNHPIEVRRGSLFSLDDAKKNNLIFVGSPAENLTLLDLPGTREFVFRRLNSSPHKGDLAILNVHPAPGEPAAFYPSDSAQPLAEDYAVVALLPGLNPDRHVMILAGTTTIGTQAAVEYVCEKDSVEELLRHLALPAGADLKPFEALLRVKVTRGVPVTVELVAVRNRK